MDDKFDPQQKFYCVKKNKALSYLECQSNFLAGDCIGCITGEENNEIIELYYQRQEKQKGKKMISTDQSKKREAKRIVYFTNRQDLMEKVEQLAKASIRTFGEQVLWMIQHYIYTQPDMDDGVKHEEAKQQALMDEFKV